MATTTAGIRIWNIPGPDLDERAFGKLFEGLTAREQVFFITTSASGFFLKPLAAAGRIVITATEADQEVNETLFPLALADVLAGRPTASTATRTADLGLRALPGRRRQRDASATSTTENLPTEHAKLDDNGDGHGSELQESYLPPELGGRSGQRAEPKFGPQGRGRPWRRSTLHR